MASFLDSFPPRAISYTLSITLLTTPISKTLLHGHGIRKNAYTKPILASFQVVSKQFLMKNVTSSYPISIKSGKAIECNEKLSKPK